MEYYNAARGSLPAELAALMRDDRVTAINRQGSGEWMSR